MTRGLLVALFLAALSCAAVAQQEHSHEGVVGQFYQSWMIPGPRTHSCCNKNDCYQTEVRPYLGSHWQYLNRANGHWVEIPDNKLENNQPDPRESPDGQGHVCASPDGHVYCAVVGVQM